jgi:RNA polymerase primary sigma factor/RNA polymerase nonessential primary-like sigma factor
MLTPAEEIELGTAIQRWKQHPEPVPPGIRRRGMKARERFVTANLRLAVAFVSRKCHRLAKAHSQEDLIQAANEGIIKAVERFDPTRGYRFSTYAYCWIWQAVNRYADLHGRTISIPGSHSQHLGRLAVITRRLTLELNRTPTRDELARELGVSLRVLDAVIENGRSISSLDAVISEDGQELGETLASWDQSLEDQEEQQERWRQAEQLRGLIATLPVQDQRLLRQAWALDGEERPRREIAERAGLSIRALDVRLQRLQAQLAAQSVQLVLVAVARVPVALVKRQRRRRVRLWVDQLELMVA